MELKKLDEISKNSFDIFLEEFRKAVMLQSQLKRKFNNNKPEENSKKYKQQDYCVKRKTKVEYIQNMNVSKVSYNKMFWKSSVKPRFSNKFKTANKITLTVGDMIMKNEKLIADTFNKYFADITKTLKLKNHPRFDSLYLVLLITSETMKA